MSSLRKNLLKNRNVVCSPVRDGEHCAVTELLSNRALNQFIGFAVYTGRGLIEKELQAN